MVPLTLSEWRKKIRSERPEANFLTLRTYTMCTIGWRYETDELIATWKSEVDYSLPEPVPVPTRVSCMCGRMPGCTLVKPCLGCE